MTQDCYAQPIMLLDTRQNRNLATIVASNLSIRDFAKHDARAAPPERQFSVYRFPGEDLRGNNNRRLGGAFMRVGVDIISVDRFGVLSSATAIVFDVFTMQEQAICHDDPRRFAGRYAAKEAIAKARESVDWDPLSDIEIMKKRGKS